jgi:nucleoside-diphosphate-sugar epimerase
MRHLITGGSGFIGNLVARRLHERGEQVRVLDVWADPLRPPDIEYVECSVTDRDGVARAMQGIDLVHHNAALVAQTDAGRQYWQVNVEGSRIVAEAAARAGVQAIIHTSSTSVYGIPEDQPITSATPTRPVEPYGRSKLAGERAVEEVCQRHGIPLLTLRPRATLGAGRLGIFQILFQWIKENRSVYVIGSGDIRFQFIHARDLMDFYMLALDAGRSGTYNVGTDRFGTLRGDLERLIRYAGSTSEVRSLPEGLTINTLRLLYWLRVSPLVPGTTLPTIRRATSTSSRCSPWAGSRATATWICSRRATTGSSPTPSSGTAASARPIARRSGRGCYGWLSSFPEAAPR